MPFLNRLTTFSFTKESLLSISGFMLIKNLLLLINCLSMLSGVLLIGAGVYAVTNEGLAGIATSIGNAAIAIGVIVTVVSFLGCFGAANEKGMLLKTYFGLLVILVVLEVSVGIAAYAKRTNMHETLNTMWSSMYNGAEYKALLLLETTFDCCGFNSTTSLQYPSNCTSLIHTDTSCLTAISSSVNSSLSTIGATGVVIGIIELIGLIFSALLFRKISKREEAQGNLLNEAWRINRNKIQYGYQNYQYV